MKRYEKYKPSGIEWIGEVPEHWGNITLQNSADTFIDGDWIESPDISSDGIRYITTGNIGVLNYKEQGAGYITEETFKKLDCTEVFPGDILISRLNEPIGRSCIIPDLNNRIVTSVDNVIYRPKADVFDKRFVVYQMNCHPYTINANLLARGTTMHRISRSTLGKIKLIFPPIAEQEAIAAYLDARCADIDKVVATQQKRIALLQELKQSEITQAVTRGLNPDARMKDSGVEWIGLVPEHWEIQKIKFSFDIFAGATPKTDKKDYWDGDIVWVTPADYKTEDKYIIEGQRTITKEGYDSCNTQVVPVGSIIFSKRAPIGTVAINKVELCTNQGCLSCVPKGVNSVYYYYVMSIATEFFDLLGSGATFKEISADSFANVKLPCPNLAEQLEIVEYLDRRCGEIDKQIGAVTKQIELLREYKQALITEVVTGKRKVD